jgi:hypothetical protein
MHYRIPYELKGLYVNKDSTVIVGRNCICGERSGVKYGGKDTPCLEQEKVELFNSDKKK